MLRKMNRHAIEICAKKRKKICAKHTSDEKLMPTVYNTRVPTTQEQ